MKLYATVFKQYVRTLVSDGYPIEVFTEGGRTRTGKLLLPKLGFLYYLIEAVYAGYNNDLVFVPIAIDYDRILEEKSFVKELKGKKKKNESLASVIKTGRLLRRKYGRLYVSFSDPFTLKEIVSGENDIKALPDLVANRITNKINEVTVVTPFALVTTAILNRTTKGCSISDLKEKSEKLFSYLIHCNARLSGTLKNSPYLEEIVRQVVEAYKDDKILRAINVEENKEVKPSDEFLTLREEERSRICFYKNSIIHYFLPVSFTSLALIYLHSTDNKETHKESAVREKYNFIKDLFRREFLFTDDFDSCKTINDVACDYCAGYRFFAKRPKGSVTMNIEKKDDIRFFSTLLRDHFESYYAVLKYVLNIGKKQISKDELISSLTKNALKMYHLGEIKLQESISVPQFNNAVMRFADMGILKANSRDLKDAKITLNNAEEGSRLLEKINSYIKIMD